jgi:hypothetical protein
MLAVMSDERVEVVAAIVRGLAASDTGDILRCADDAYDAVLTAVTVGADGVPHPETEARVPAWIAYRAAVASRPAGAS